MTLIRKAALFCNGCGMRLDLDWETASHLTFSRFMPTEEVAGWRELDSGRHLCPDCARRFAEREAALKSELDGLVGFKDADFEL